MIDYCKQLTGNAFINVTRAVNSDSTDPESMVQAEFFFIVKQKRPIR